MTESSSRIIWEGSSWRLREERVLLPNGALYAKGIVDHPGSVALVPYKDGRIFMIQQFRLALKQTILELPAGTRGWDEAWLECAQRELQEEIGYQAESFTPLGRLWPSPGMSNEEMVIFLATGLSPAPLPPDLDEQIEVTPMALTELLPMVKDGRIQDAKTIIGVLRAAAELGR